MKQATNFAGKLLAVCLALVLAASMLAVPAWAGDGNSTGTGDPGTTPPASSDDGGSSGITGGTLQYKLDGGSYNAELPKATNAGSYTVYYKVKGNNTTHSDSSEQSFTVTIAPQTVTAAVSVEPTSYTYTGEAIVPTTGTIASPV